MLNYPEGVSDRYGQILDVLAGIHQAHPLTLDEFNRARIEAIEAVAEYREALADTARSKRAARQQLNTATPHLDRLVWAWLTEGDGMLKRLLQEHAVTDADRQAVQSFFRERPHGSANGVAEDPREIDTAPLSPEQIASLPQPPPSTTGDENLMSELDEAAQEADTAPLSHEEQASSAQPTAAIPRFLFQELPPPTVTREELETLDDWESWLRWRIRQVELLGEIDIAEDEYRQLGRLFAALLKMLSRVDADRALRQEYPAAFLAFLTTAGVHEYHAGNYWAPVAARTGVSQGKRANWGSIFKEGLAAFGLPQFDNIVEAGATAYVSVMLMHGGIPNYCLGDFFDNVLLPAVTRPQYMDLSTAELIDAVLDRSAAQLFTDVPVQRFLEFGDKVAEDFFERSREMFLAFAETGVLRAAEEIGLPQRVLTQFAHWTVEQEMSDVSRTVRDRLRLRRPQVKLDPWGDGVSLLLPSQEIPATLAQEELAWHVRGVGQTDATMTVPLRVRRIGYDLRTEEHSLVLDKPVERVECLFLRGGDTQRQWSLPVHQEDMPLVVFEPGQQTVLAWRHSLPAAPLWLLYPVNVDIEFDGQEYCVERFPELPDGWHEFTGGEWDLTDVRGITLIEENGERHLIAVRPGDQAARPALVGGALLQHSTDRQGAPVFVGRPPKLRLPLTSRMTPAEEAQRWKITLQSKWAAQPDVDRSFDLTEAGAAVSLEDDALLLDLAAPGMLGAEVRGRYRVRARGPLGKDADFSFRIWPNLDVWDLDDLYLPSDAGPPEVVFQVIVPEGDQVVSQLGVEGLVARPDPEEPRIYHITAAPAVCAAELALLHETATGDMVQMPVRLRIPRLRWTLSEQTILALKSWQSSALRRSVDEFVQAETIPSMMVDMPYRGADSLRLRLRLRDIDNEVLQANEQDYVSTREQRYWRLSLGEFRDTVRLSNSPLLRLELLIAGLAGNASQQAIHLITFTRHIEATDVRLDKTDNGESPMWTLRWQQERPLKNLHARLWPAWRPWEPAHEVALPAETIGQVVFSPGRLWTDGRYLVDFYVTDPWVPTPAPERPGEHTPGIALADTVPPEAHLTWLHAHIAAASDSYDLRFERACVHASLQELDACMQDVDWCCQNIQHIDLERILALHAWLATHNADDDLRKALSLRMFTVQKASQAIEDWETGVLPDDQFHRYLEAAPPARLWPLGTARLLLSVPHEATVIKALQALIWRGEAQGIEKLLALVKDHRLSEKDAIGLLATNGDVAIGILEKAGSDPIVIRLLEGLRPEFGDQVPVIRPDIWVNCGAGWGQIRRIVDPGTNMELPYFIRGQKPAILEVLLRAGEDAFEPAVVDLEQDEMCFTQAEHVWTCTKCDRFSSHSEHLCYRHDRYAHEGHGASHRREPGNTRLIQMPVLYRSRRPMKIWE